MLVAFVVAVNTKSINVQSAHTCVNNSHFKQQSHRQHHLHESASRILRSSKTCRSALVQVSSLLPTRMETSPILSL